MKADLEEEEDANEELEEIKPVELPSNSWDIYNVEQLKLYFKGPNHNIQGFFKFALSANQIYANRVQLMRERVSFRILKLFW